MFTDLEEIEAEHAKSDARTTKTPRLKSTSEFVALARGRHGPDTYNYGEVEYTTKSTKVAIACPRHGRFLQTPSNHLNGSGCPKCGLLRIKKSKTKTRHSFISQAVAIHGSRYGYDEVDYKGSNIRVSITCQKHGAFDQIPSSHLTGSGCPECAMIARHEHIRLTQEEFLARAEKVHGDKYVYADAVYKGASVEVAIECRVHGKFSQIPGNHLSGAGCPKCGRAATSLKRRTSYADFVKRAKIVHGAVYDYGQECDFSTGARAKIRIECPRHGPFQQMPYRHLGGDGCPKCGHVARGLALRMPFDEFERKAHAIHGTVYSYIDSERSYSGASEEVWIECLTHGPFKQIAKVHLQGHGCPTCAMEQRIRGGLHSGIACEWLDWEARRRKLTIRHAINGGEKCVRLADGKLYSFDGFCERTNEVFEFHGSYWHAHPILLPNRNAVHPAGSGRTNEEVYKATLQRESAIKKAGYKLTVMWEHDWRRMRDSEAEQAKYLLQEEFMDDVFV